MNQKRLRTTEIDHNFTRALVQRKQRLMWSKCTNSLRFPRNNRNTSKLLLTAFVEIAKEQEYVKNKKVTDRQHTSQWIFLALTCARKSTCGYLIFSLISNRLFTRISLSFLWEGQKVRNILSSNFLLVRTTFFKQLQQL